MSKELVISSNRHETKVAILEEDQLVEIYFQRANEYSLAGSIHKGRVTRVLPGMQSAFVDLGLERDTFLYVSDFFEENGDEYDQIADEKPARAPSRAEQARVPAPVAPLIVPATSPEASPDVEAAHEPDSTAVPVSPPAERTEDGDGRDRRGGRRSRRRRSRGRGFPESKYASVSEDAESSEAEPAGDEKGSEGEGGVEEVFVLPGESLAKYRTRPSENGDGAIPETDDQESPDERLETEQTAETDELPEQVDDSSLTMEPIGIPPEAIVSAFPEPGFFAPAMSLEPDKEPEKDPDEDEPTTQAAEAVPPTAESSGPQSDHQTTEGDDSDTAVAVLVEEHNPVDRLESSGSDLDEREDSEGEQSEADEPEAAAPEQAASASVRADQGSRFQHRPSRRMRRRGRGGDQPQRAPEPAPEPVPDVRTASPRGGEKPTLPSITDLLREGQEIIVQIAKEPLGQKGARITSHIALPGRYVVYMPTLEHMGVSRKIASDEERQRLKRILQTHRAGMTGGFIVRTAGEGHTEDEIGSDMAYLYNLWLDIRQKAEKRPAPALLHHDLDIVQRILRDQLNDMFKAIWCDNEEIYESVLGFMQRIQPQLVGRVKLYTRPTPIFDAFNVTQEVEKALRPKVWLKSGGYIVINQTEALVAVDVNTGKYVGKSNRLEDTITKTNTEAVKEIVRQIRLRDLGGIIVVDFIDMDERKNRQKVMLTLEEAMRADRAPYKILQFNDFGLVAITRKRVKQSLERSLCSPCPTCEGGSFVKSVQTVVGEVLQEAAKVRKMVEGKNVMLRAHPEVAKFLKSSSNTYLEEIEEILGRSVLVTSDPLLHPEKFDLAW